MASSYTSFLGLVLPVQGELSGTWGDTVNNYLTTYIDAAVAGAQTVTADTTLTKTTGSSLGSTSSQYAIIIASPASANITITAPAASKIYTIINTSATYTVTIRGAGPTTGVTIATNDKAIVAWNGSDFVRLGASAGGSLSTASASSVTPAIASYNQYAFTALAASLTINAPTGTPVDGDKLIFRILDNGSARTLSWNATYTAIGVTLPTTTTASKTTYVGCIYNANNTRWDVVAVTTQA